MMTIEERISRCERSARWWRAGAITLAAGWMIAAGTRGPEDLTVRKLVVTDSIIVGQEQAGHIRMMGTAVGGGPGATMEIWGVPHNDGLILEGRPDLGSVQAWAGGAIATMEANMRDGKEKGWAAFEVKLGDSEAHMLTNRTRSLLAVKNAGITKVLHP